MSQDLFSTNAQALARIEWAVGCLYVPAKLKEKWMKTVENGVVVERQFYSYPSFAVDDAAASYPTWKPEPGGLTTAAGSFNCAMPDNVIWLSVCEAAGCYRADQRILMESGYKPISVAHEQRDLSLVTLSPSATFGDLAFTVNTVDKYTVSPIPELETLLTFQTEHGGKLTVTPLHPLVTKDGTIEKASQFVVGDSLVKDDGSLDTIETIATSREVVKVYNVQPTTKDFVSNVLVAEGFLNGSVRYQNEYQKYLGRVVLREARGGIKVQD